MPKRRRVLILANSHKERARCVAGIEANGKRVQDWDRWVRPVSNSYGNVTFSERQYADHSEPVPGEMATMSLLAPEGRSDHQRENWTLDASVTWRRERSLSWSDLARLPTTDDPLWPDKEASDTQFGRNNRVRESHAQHLTSSLRLVRVPKLQVHLISQSQGRLDASFQLGTTEYRLRVTDPVFEERYRDQPGGTYDLGECLLTISLGEPYKGFCYKLVASVIEREQYGK